MTLTSSDKLKFDLQAQGNDLSQKIEKIDLVQQAQGKDLSLIKDEQTQMKNEQTQMKNEQTLGFFFLLAAGGYGYSKLGDSIEDIKRPFWARKR